MNLSQKDLYKELDVSFATMNRWKNEKAIPRKKTRRLLIDYCKKRSLQTNEYKYKNYKDVMIVNSNKTDIFYSKEVWKVFSEMKAIYIAMHTKPRFALTKRESSHNFYNFYISFYYSNFWKP